MTSNKFQNCGVSKSLGCNFTVTQKIFIFNDFFGQRIFLSYNIYTLLGSLIAFFFNFSGNFTN
jgi:hypothetical protein